MSEIVRICKEHGPLKIDDMIKSGVQRGKQMYKCRQCVKQIHRKNYEAKKDAILKRCHEYRIANREKVLEMKRISNKKSYHVYKAKPSYRESQIRHGKKRVAELYDAYIAHMIVKNSSLRRRDIPPEMISAKREVLRMSRKLKSIKTKQREENNE